ncbi:PREDICTED: GDSL esterase/lipase At1g28600-like [Ipomoea nil]|uniref:GDSL esterase/lipase At1g28600-like n=1 Tax=Ipomoea nil TaxID=35883 RepID=UPI0009016B83|nr:PREDICTED: GDSL esterase/lipase At1g28600-like [Ipomoea nil]
MACIYLLTKTSSTNALLVAVVVAVAVALSSSPPVVGCYTSIFGFGDSLTDTGNYMASCLKGVVQCDDEFLKCGIPPYGKTFFHRPTGRCSDGRLIIDFIAEHYGLPLVPPYTGGENVKLGGSVNFAVVGAPALDDTFRDEQGTLTRKDISMKAQLDRFKDFLPSICKTSNCEEIFGRSLIVFGPFGGDDYSSAMSKKDIKEAQLLQPRIVNAIASAIEELIELGAANIMVPGMMPDGCLSVTLTLFYGSNENAYDPTTGCLSWLNEFAQNHNKLLQNELNRIRDRHPNVFITYADYYNAALQLFRFPATYGFHGRTLDACCGSEGPYNVDNSIDCGYPSSNVCADPSSYIDWDGPHFTEAANRWIAKGLLNGLYTNPNITASCDSATVNSL